MVSYGSVLVGEEKYTQDGEDKVQSIQVKGRLGAKGGCEAPGSNT